MRVKELYELNNDELHRCNDFAMGTLHLNLKKKWFNMILSGEKKEEYREATKYWMYRICRCDRRTPDKCGEFDFCGRFHFVTPGNFNIVNIPNFKTITFSNGYRKNSPRMIVELLKVKYGEGKEEWGAIPGIDYLVLSLGKILETKNC